MSLFLPQDIVIKIFDFLLPCKEDEKKKFNLVVKQLERRVEIQHEWSPLFSPFNTDCVCLGCIRRLKRIISYNNKECRS